MCFYVIQVSGSQISVSHNHFQRATILLKITGDILFGWYDQCFNQQNATRKYDFMFTYLQLGKT